MPTNSSAKFSGNPIIIERNATIVRAFAQSEGNPPSQIVQAGPFTIRAAAPNLVQFTQEPESIFKRPVKGTKDAGGGSGGAGSAAGAARGAGAAGAETKPASDTKSGQTPPFVFANEKSAPGEMSSGMPPGMKGPGTAGSSNPTETLDPSVDPDIVACQKAGNCAPSVKIDMPVARSGETVHCTMDGTVPTQASPVCDGIVEVTMSGTVVKAIVLADDLEPSKIFSSPPIDVRCYPPTIEPFGGVFIGHVLVTIKPSQTDTTVFYTMDGSVPTTSSRKYTGPLDIVESGSIVSAFELSLTSSLNLCGISPVKSSNLSPHSDPASHNSDR
jgi:hypothetical protein